MAYYCGGSVDSSGGITVGYKANWSGNHSWAYNLGGTSKSGGWAKSGTWTSTDEGTMTKSLYCSYAKTNTMYWGEIASVIDHGSSSDVTGYYLKYYSPPAAPSVSYYTSYNSSGNVFYVTPTDVSDGSALTPSLRISVDGTNYYNGAFTSGQTYSFTVPYNGSSTADLRVYLVTSTSGSTTTSNGGTATLSASHSAVTPITASVYPSYPTYYTKTLQYNANGGTGAPASQSSTSTSYSTTFTISSTTPTRTGYNFLGWSSTSTGSVEYSPGGSITVSAGTKTIYAVWEASSSIRITAKVDGVVVTGKPYVKKEGVWKPVVKGYLKESDAWNEETEIDLT